MTIFGQNQFSKNQRSRCGEELVDDRNTKPVDRWNAVKCVAEVFSPGLIKQHMPPNGWLGNRRDVVHCEHRESQRSRGICNRLPVWWIGPVNAKRAHTSSTKVAGYRLRRPVSGRPLRRGQQTVAGEGGGPGNGQRTRRDDVRRPSTGRWPPRYAYLLEFKRWSTLLRQYGTNSAAAANRVCVRVTTKRGASTEKKKLTQKR